MDTFDTLIVKKRDEIDAHIAKAQKEHTRTLFKTLKHELSNVKSVHDLELKITHVQSLKTTAKKEDTRRIFSVLEKELLKISRSLQRDTDNVAQAPLQHSKATQLRKYTPRPIKKKEGVPTPGHPITVKRKTRKTQKKQPLFSQFVDSFQKKKKTDDRVHAPKKGAPVIKSEEIREEDLFSPDFEGTEQALATPENDKKNLLGKGKAKAPFFTRIREFFVEMYEIYLLKKHEKPLEEFQDEIKDISTHQSHVKVQSIFSRGYLRMLVKHLFSIQKNRPFGEDEQTEIALSTLQLENIRRKQSSQRTKDSLVAGIAHERGNLLYRTASGEKHEYKVYEASLFGLYANQFCRQISFYLLKNFPDFFKKLYTALRLANIKILSNTYVNIMIFSVILAYGVFGVFFLLIFLFKYPIFIAIPRALVMAMIGSISAFGFLYLYPFVRLQERSRSITTNLPFAITNMAAVASAGVPPNKMFKLIVESKEYGEFSTEIEKIVEYTELFGYDLMTAIRSIKNITPSKPMREFFEGMLNTIESGGNLTGFLQQKATETMENYELERKKYTESVATYSDIYTGILIAAPLFFVSALSLVSLLGGTVGNLDVSVLIVLGTYLIIPFLNVAFLTFLSITQPDV